MRTIFKISLVLCLILMLSTSALGYAFGSKVAHNNYDWGYPLIFLTANPNDIGYVDSGANGYDVGDTVYLRKFANSDARVRLSWGNGNPGAAPGTKVEMGDQDYNQPLNAFNAPDFVFNDISGVIGTYDRFDRVYFTTDIGSGLLLTGDDRLSVPYAGTKIRNFNPENGRPWTAFPIASIQYVEIDGNAGYNVCSDFLYLHIGGSHTVSTGDIRLTPTP